MPLITVTKLRKELTKIGHNYSDFFEKWSYQNQNVSIIKFVLTFHNLKENFLEGFSFIFTLEIDLKNGKICHFWSFIFLSFGRRFEYIFDHGQSGNLESEIQTLKGFYYLTPFNPQRSFIICKFAKSWWQRKRGRWNNLMHNKLVSKLAGLIFTKSKQEHLKRSGNFRNKFS